MSERSCKLFRITGRVQGVFFRDSTRSKARHLGLTGYATNQSDGSVEVLACGAADAVEALADWLREGPRMAVVEGLEARPVAVDVPTDFTIG